MQLNDLVAEYLFECECRKLSPKTIINYKKLLQYFLRYLESKHNLTILEKLSAQQIKAFLIQKQKEGKKPAYINDLLKVIKSFAVFLQAEGYTQGLLTEKVKNVKQPKVIIQPFSLDEVKEMISCYNKQDFLSVRNKAIICLFFDTGIRLNELMTLTDDRIYNDYILIYGKGNKERVVPKTPYLSRILFKYMRVRDAYFLNKRITDGSTFPSKNGHRLTHEAVERLVKAAGAYARVREGIRISPHTCRHTYAQMQLKNGLDLYTLSRLLGHESITITQRYLEGIRDKEVLRAGMITSPLMNL